MDVKPGTIFSTPFEVGCIAQTEPDDRGSFDALDSDGVLCSFHLRMVTEVTGEAQS